MIARRSFVVGAAAAVTLPAFGQARPDFYPIPVELLAGLDRLNGRVTLGAQSPDVTIVEFFDYNCGFCRRTARDVRPLLQSDNGLRYVLVNYAVLGLPSLLATRVALAFSRQKANRYLDFHEAMFARNGTRDANLAIDVAMKLGADRKRLLEDADSDAVTEAMKASARLGENFNFNATPSFLVGRDAFSGALALEQKRTAIRAFRQCERANCG